MLKMKKTLCILLLLLFLLSVTVTAVSAQPTLRNAPPAPKLDATKDLYGRYMAPIGAKITLFDKSTGTITGKKWYVDGELISTSMAKKITYTTYDMGYHTFKLKVGNGSGSRTTQLTYHFYCY